MTLRDRRTPPPAGYPSAVAIGGLGAAVIAVGVPPFSLIVGAFACITAIVIAYQRHHRGES